MQLATGAIIGIINFPKPIRQAECDWSKGNTQPVRQPFGHEIDGNLAVMTDIGAHVEEMMCAYRTNEPLCEFAADAGPHIAQSERDDAHERAAIIQIEREGNASLQG